jgi:hypothetical protein
VVVEEEDQWIDISIYDTGSGKILSSAFAREGGGSFDPTGRYYYHGDDNSSDAALHKYDVTGDQFYEMAHTPKGYGARTVLVSENGSRIFWNGSAYDSALVETWAIGDEIFAASSDGNLAFGKGLIYDVNRRKVVLGMPVDTQVSAFNSRSSKLVVQAGNDLAFYQVTSPVSISAPVLALESADKNSLVLTWSDRSLETSFTVQWRLAGSTNWQDVDPLARNTV